MTDQLQLNQQLVNEINVLRQKENFYRLIFEKASDAMFIVSDAKIIDCNERALKLFRCQRISLINRAVINFFPVKQPDGELSKDIALKKLKSALAGRPQLFEWQHRRLDGTLFMAEVSLNSVNIDGQLVIQAIMRDITTRKQAETALTRQAQLFENISDGVIVTDLKGLVIDLNPASVVMFGYNKAEMIGKSLDFTKYVTKNIINKVLLEGKWSGEINFCRKNGARGILHTEVVPLRDERAQVIAVIWVNRDITERKQLEEQLKYLSLHDPLTGLYNRAYFDQELKRLEDSREYPISIIQCDMDSLKFINDTLGHDAGDEYLKQVANLIKKCFRKNDVVARVGGDEFSIVLPNSGVNVVEAAYYRIKNEICHYNQQHNGFYLSISIGYAVAKDASISLKELLKRADHSMYKEKMRDKQSVRKAVIDTLMKTLEVRDFSGGHTNRLCELAASLATKIGYPQEKQTDLLLLAQFHDVGKVGLSDELLFKPGRVTEEEFNEIKLHSEIGHRIALSTPELVPIADWILKHHEWWNGHGYPLGLKEEEIPLECRILAIIDAYDAMTSDRPYRKAKSHPEAMIELEKGAGTQFDPSLVVQFKEIMANEKREPNN